MRKSILACLAFVFLGVPGVVIAQYSESKMGEYLHYAVAAAKGGIYAGIDGIGYTGVGFGAPSLYQSNTGWVDLPVGQGFDTSLRITGAATAISHDGSVVAGYVSGTTAGGVSKQVAAFWVNGVESVIPAPPDDPGAVSVSATAVSGDGTTLLVQDGTPYTASVETFVYNIAGGTFTSLGFLGGTNHQTFATAINSNGTVVAGYSALDGGNIEGFIWNATNGMAVLGIPTDHPNTVYLEPTCMSDDGTTLYGKLTELNGWVGFRYNTTNGFQDLGNLPYMEPSACTADGTEVVGIAFLYFPAIWSVSNGGGYLDHLVSANIGAQALGTTEGPVTISPDGTAVTALGPDAYPVDQVWYGTWQVALPAPLKTAAIPSSAQSFSTDYQTTLIEAPGTLTENADFNTGASVALVKGPHYASSFTLNADGSFSYKPKPGYISAGLDPETGTPTDTFTYHLVSANGTSSNVQVQINVSPPMPPTVASPACANVTATSATLGGTMTDGGGMPIMAMGVVYAPTGVNNNPQMGGDGVTGAIASVASNVFTVDVTNLLPGTSYSYAAYATNSAGIGYTVVDSFTTLANLQSWQLTWYGSSTNAAAAYGADPYGTGVANVAVFAFLGPNQDPSTANVTELPQLQMTGGYLSYDFFEPPGISGVTYGAQSSAKLNGGSWETVADTGVWPEHIFSVPAQDNAEAFLRLTVTSQ